MLRGKQKGVTEQGTGPSLIELLQDFHLAQHLCCRIWGRRAAGQLQQAQLVALPFRCLHKYWGMNQWSRVLQDTHRNLSAILAFILFLKCFLKKLEFTDKTQLWYLEELFQGHFYDQTWNHNSLLETPAHAELSAIILHHLANSNGSFSLQSNWSLPMKGVSPGLQFQKYFFFFFPFVCGSWCPVPQERGQVIKTSVSLP